MINEILAALLDRVRRQADIIPGLTLPPEQRSIMPGVNALQQRQNLSQAPYVDPTLLNAVLGGVMVPAENVYHGSTSVINKINPQHNAGRTDLLRGPGFYTTNNPAVASEYAAGMTQYGPSSSVERIMQQADDLNALAKVSANSASKAKFLEQADNLRPNVMPFEMQPHNTFDVSNFPTDDINSLLAAVRRQPWQDKATKYGTVSAETQAQNLHNSLVNSFTNPGMSPLNNPLTPGESVFQTLHSIMGPDKANALLREAGFQSIKHPGGILMGGPKHTAYNVLDEAILEPLVKAMAKKKRLPEIPE